MPDSTATRPLEPWYDTICPAEHRDGARSSVYETASAAVRDMGGQTRVSVEKVGDIDGGWPAVTRRPEELFLLHGMLGFPGFTGATLTRVEVSRAGPSQGGGAGAGIRPEDGGAAGGKAPGGRVAWSRKLLEAVAIGEWNYPGSVLAHQDGWLYVIYGYRLSRVDPVSGEVMATVELPTTGGRVDTTYNGFVLLPDGNILAKSLYRKPGTRANGFRALSRGGLVGTPSDLVVVAPGSLRILDQLRAPEHLLGRITVGISGGSTWIYAAGMDHIYRVGWSGEKLVMDPHWGPVRYRQEGEAPGSAITVAGDWMFIQGNAGPARVPFTITAICQGDSRRIHRVKPFPDHRLSFNASKLTVDAENLRMYTTDGLAGRLAAYDFDPEAGFTKRWEVAQGSYSFLVLVGPAHKRVLIATHLRDNWWSWFVRTRLSWFVPWLAYRIAGEEIVWRNPDDGEELARSPRVPAGLAIIPGYDGAIFYPTVFGGVLRLVVEGGAAVGR